MCGLGQISYGLYFSHNLVLILLYTGAKALGLGYRAWLQAVVLALSVGVAGLSWAYIERPVLALKDWLPYEREPAQGREAVPALEASRTRAGADRPRPMGGLTSRASEEAAS